MEECKITDTTPLKLSPYIKNIRRILLKNNSASSANINGTIACANEKIAEYVKIMFCGNILDIPIPNIAEDIIKIISEHNRVVEELKELPEFIKNMEDAIDNLVYDLYGLDAKEREVVEEFCSRG